MKFRAHKKQFRLPFYIVADFESFLEPTDDSEFDRGMKVINNHEVSGFACHRVTDIKEYKTARYKVPIPQQSTLTADSAHLRPSPQVTKLIKGLSKIITRYRYQEGGRMILDCRK